MTVDFLLPLLSNSETPQPCTEGSPHLPHCPKISLLPSSVMVIALRSWQPWPPLLSLPPHFTTILQQCNLNEATHEHPPDTSSGAKHTCLGDDGCLLTQSFDTAASDTRVFPDIIQGTGHHFSSPTPGLKKLQEYLHIQVCRSCKIFHVLASSTSFWGALVVTCKSVLCGGPALWNSLWMLQSSLTDHFLAFSEDPSFWQVFWLTMMLPGIMLIISYNFAGGCLKFYDFKFSSLLQHIVPPINYHKFLLVFLHIMYTSGSEMF